MRTMNLLEELQNRVICGDGAMGTLLLEAGFPLERCYEELCVTEPERIEEIHRHYISAGARVIKTNTFGANAVRLAKFGLEDGSRRLIARRRKSRSRRREGKMFMWQAVLGLWVLARKRRWREESIAHVVFGNR